MTCRDALGVRHHILAVGRFPGNINLPQVPGLALQADCRTEILVAS